MFIKYLKESFVKEAINEGFLKDLMKAFKGGYQEEAARLAIEKEMRDEEKKIDMAMKAMNCKSARKDLKKIEKSIHRNSKEGKLKIKELKDAIQYCTKLGEFKAFIKKNWDKGQNAF